MAEGGRPGRCTKYASLKAVRPSVMPVRRAQLVRMCAEEDVAPKEEVVQKAPEVPVPTAQEAAVPAAEDPYGDLPPERYPGYYKDLERSGLDPREEMAKAAKKRKIGGKASLYKADGTPYAPWMVGTVSENVPDATPRKPKTDAVGKLANDPQAQEVAGVGLRYKVIGDELLLIWATGGEPNNKGFIVRKRAGKTDEWVQVADYKSHPAELTSKGPQGSDYTFLDKEAEPGTWVYRVTDVDQQGRQSDLSQTIVTVQSSNEQRTQVIALVAVIVLLAAFAAVGLSLDPISSL